jgi:hypothetical protein
MFADWPCRRGNRIKHHSCRLGCSRASAFSLASWSARLTDPIAWVFAAAFFAFSWVCISASRHLPRRADGSTQLTASTRSRINPGAARPAAACHCKPRLWRVPSHGNPARCVRAANGLPKKCRATLTSPLAAGVIRQRLARARISPPNAARILSSWISPNRRVTLSTMRWRGDRGRSVAPSSNPS